MEYKTLSMDCEVSLDNPNPNVTALMERMHLTDHFPPEDFMKWADGGFKVDHAFGLDHEKLAKVHQIQRINELHAFGWQMKLALMALEIIEKRSNGEAIPNGTAYALGVLGFEG